MDSYNFHFERMSNVDLHPLSLPVSRLSPAKSNSSIVDQLAHHQHGKGDSAYSSFSGGSTAPDYPSSFLADELQSNSFGHYADLKYVRSIYPPNQVLQSDPKTMDQLYRSVEAISQQYRNNNDGFHANNRAAKHEVPLGAPIPYSRPPPIPARLDSFIATKNLENNRVQHHGTESQPQQPQPQQPRTNQRLHRQSHGAPRGGPANPETGNPDPVYAEWRAAAAQSQQPPSYRLHLQPQDQTRAPLTPEYLSVADNKAASEQKSTNVLSRSPPRGTSQSEHLQPRQPSSGGGCNGDHHHNPGGHFESQRKRAHSAHDLLGGEPTRASSPWNAGQSFINSSIQHKGQFYFVTGVCKLSDSSLRTQSVSVCGSDAGSESSSVYERQQLREKERCHSTMDNLFKPLKESSRSSSGMILDEKEGLPYEGQGKGLISKNSDQENHRPTLLSTRSSRSFDSLEDIDMSREMGRHTANNPIFYCGPERNCSPRPEVASLLCNDQSNHHKREEPAKRGKRLPLTDVASQRINKETTPLLYHLTGASRAALQPKKDADFGVKGIEGVLSKASHGDLSVSNSERPPQGETTTTTATKSDQGDDASTNCNTLDDSFKKYYKEKLKDAQSKVLRETSFKRRDLQLSWPHRIRQKPELRPAAIHSFSSSQDSETSTDTLTPSVASEETEKGSIKEEAEESEKEASKETEKENGRPAKVAQPQVARVKGRKRLTPEQKKMCYSEPDKLNQLGSAPKHSACRSFGNESDSSFSLDYDGGEPEQQGEQGLVAARRKMFETRGRALSASSASKSNLKHLRHKALVEYMERKTGFKVAEPQQPAPQQPPPPRQRHSLGEKPFDWGPRPLSAHHEVKNPKKKPHRPHSAGRILDSSTSSIRYAQFLPAQSSSGQANESRWRESQGPSQGKFASAESLLDQPEPPKVFRNRSTSTPHAFQAHDFEQDPLPANTMETSRPETNVGEVELPPEAPQRQRVVAQRGKSMEELGASKLTRLSALSKSSEQLDQMRRRSAGHAGSDRDRRNVFVFAEAREAQGQERARGAVDAGKEPEKNTQGAADLQRKPLLKQNSEPAPGDTEAAAVRTSSRSASPASCASPRGRVHSASPRSHSPATEELRSSRPPSETPSNPPSPRSQEPSEREIKSASSTPTQTKPPCESRPSTRGSRTPPSVSRPEREQLVDEPGKDDDGGGGGGGPPLDSKREVSLSCGVTTDPSLWILPPAEDEQEEDTKGDAQIQPLTDDVFEEPAQTSDAPEPPGAPDVTQRADGEETPEAQDEKPEESPEETGERGAPEGEGEAAEGESPPRPASSRPRWGELVEAVVRADPSLAVALYPLADRKTALMLMEQLLSEDTLLMEEHYKKKQEQRGNTESAETAEASPQPPAPDCAEPAEPQSKADLAEKKRLLMSHIEERLRSLEESRGALQAEVRDNAAHGEALRALVAERCPPVELERYSQFIGDLERVVSLLLCLSARLARVQNALSTVDQHTDADEKQSLDSRHRLLCKQREDAKDLKDNLDRRESQVSAFLSRQLTAEQLQDYRRFVQTKASLLIRQKDLEEKQRLGEEQLEALANSLNL